MQHVLNQLNRLGLLDEQAAADAAQLIDKGEPLEHAVLSVNGLTEDRLLPVLAREFGVDLIDLGDVTPPRELLERLPANVLSRRKLMPIDEQDGRLRVATSSLFDSTGIDELRVATGLDIEPVLALSEQIDEALGKHLGVGAATMQSLVQHGGDHRRR